MLFTQLFESDFNKKPKQVNEFQMPSVSQWLRPGQQQQAADNTPGNFSVVVSGQMPNDFRAATVATALEAILPKDFPRSNWPKHGSQNSATHRVIQELQNRGQAVVKDGVSSKDIADSIAAKFKKYGVPAYVEGGMNESAIQGAVDKNGRTQQEWMQAVKKAYPDAKIMQSKMVNGPCQAVLADGRKINWVADHTVSGIAETINDDYEDCDMCSGTGEGRWEGEACSACHGTGMQEPTGDDDDADAEDDWYDNQEEPESYYEKSLRSRGLGEDAHTPEAFQDIVQRADGDVRGIYKELQERGLHSEIKAFCLWAKHQGIADIYEAIKLAKRIGLEVDDENEIAYEGYLAAKELLGQQGVTEADKKKDSPVKDVALQRAVTKARAAFPSASSDFEALAKNMLQSQEQDQDEFAKLRQAERQQDELLNQIDQVDQSQNREIGNLETKNSTLSTRLQQLMGVNSKLEKKLAAMSGRKSKTKDIAAPEPVAEPQDSTDNFSAAKAPVEPKAKAKQNKPSPIKSTAKQLASPKTPDPMAAMTTRITKGDASIINPKQSALPFDPSDNVLEPNISQRQPDPRFAAARANASDVDPRYYADIAKKVAGSPEKFRAAMGNTGMNENDDEQEADYGDKYQDMVSRVGKKAREQEKSKPVDIADLARRLAAIEASKKDK